MTLHRHKLPLLQKKICLASLFFLYFFIIFSVVESFTVNQLVGKVGRYAGHGRISSPSLHESESDSDSAHSSASDSESESDSPRPLLSLGSASPSRRDFISTASTAASIATTAIVGTTQDSSLSQTGLRLPGGAAYAAVPPPAINLPPIGLGAWAWGDSLFWGYDPKNDDELRQVYDYATSRSAGSSKIKSGVLFDSAEVYGFGVSEKLLGKFSGGINDSNKDDGVVIATKFAALPTRTKASDVVKACEASVKRLGGRTIDLYQIHFPNAWSNEAYWDGLADCYDRGLVKAVGVSNYGKDAMRACHASLAKRGIPLATNQIQLSLLYNHPLENGLLQACDDLGVKVLAYSPLALGFLTGKYTSLDNLPKGPRKSVGKKLIGSEDYQNLLKVMQVVVKNHGGDTTMSQVALNWTRAKGAIPIPGARTVRQAEQNYGALEWNLTKEEERMLDEASAKVTSFTKPEDVPFVREDVFTKLKLFDS